MDVKKLVKIEDDEGRGCLAWDEQAELVLKQYRKFKNLGILKIFDILETFLFKLLSL